MTRHAPRRTIRRKRGRMDGIQWNGSTFICAKNVDDGSPATAVDMYDRVSLFDDMAPDPIVVGDGQMIISLLDIATPAKPKGDGHMIISLLDIATPAKPKGVAKDFEVVDTIQRVIALEDGVEVVERWEVDDDKEWEEIYEDSPQEKRISYSAALRGNKR